MQTYRELFRNREFAALFTTACAQNAAGTVTGLALATEVYSRTRSPLFAALSMFGPSLAQLAGATLLLSAADRLPPRAAISSLALVTATLVGLLSTGPPIWLIFVLLLGMGLAVRSPAVSGAGCSPRSCRRTRTFWAARR